MIKIISLSLLVCLSSFTHAFQLQDAVTDIKEPTDILFLPSQPQSLLVTEKTGRLLLANLADKSHIPVHNFAVVSDVELGLLGITLHPNFATNGYLFVNYNPKEGELRTRISRFTLDLAQQNPSLRDEKIILEVAQPYKNHNAGQLSFGPDGYLYVGMGDGGSGETLKVMVRTYKPYWVLCCD
ncbi:PQQ-dependent sugar dehydrogenase [Paraglaciecola aquimarina]|uniref:PQQ-dependent sugar dehydrogenase n=1 Tax=Paraglaciecola aquimarina TaxID=1235557 RepID=A0ABU3SY59_9ALTE|nr:PQQ-dependent sugar dehydrogenase [Paraglaciecola aquimarina]MDU0354935.1 PQQ-dependent sugar dehydrogenase [Paraglaciecola aquimarina]